MANIFDYIIWRGDILFNEVPLNEIDSLILSRLSYLPFDNLIKNDEYITIEEAYRRFEINNKQGLILQKEDLKLFEKLARCERFKNLYLTEYVNKVSKEEVKQFSAITIFLPNNISYVSYRGTDNTIVGWKEDFNMGLMSHLPSQKDAVKYLDNIAKKYKGELIIGGHSKGGNLAVYASIFCNNSTKKRIIEIYNEDGPGFDTEITDTKEYKEIINKVHAYIPQSSVFGRLLNHQEKCTIVRSIASGIMQHDLYSWQVLGSKFERLENVTQSSEFVNKSIRLWLEQVSQDKREQFFNILFEMLITSETSTIDIYPRNWLKLSRKIVNEYNNIDPENKEIISKALHVFLDIVKDNIKEEILQKNNVKKDAKK